METIFSMSSRLICRGLHRGIHPVLASSVSPLHPFREEETIFDLVQATDLLPHWTTRLAGPFGLPRTRRQDASTPLLQPTFTSRALDIDITSGDCPPVAVSKPTAPSFQAGPRGGKVLPPRQPGVDAGPPRGHPASSGCALDGTPAGFGSIDPARTLSRPCGRAPALFRLTGRPVDRHPLIPTSTTGPGPGEGAAPNRLITARRGHVNARRLASRSRYLPSHGTEPDALAGARRGALRRLAGLRSFRAFSPVYEDTD
jgi:hypothetical protein